VRNSIGFVRKDYVDGNTEGRCDPRGTERYIIVRFPESPGSQLGGLFSKKGGGKKSNNEKKKWREGEKGRGLK